MSAPRALVTGATGFLGGALARTLHAQGWAVTATGRNLQQGEALRRAGLHFEPADLTHAELTARLCEAQDVVFHCAALSSPWGPPQAFEDANVTATNHVVLGCLLSGARLVHVSTPSVYVGYGDALNVREDAPLPRPVNAYAASKRRAETLVRAGAAKGLHTVILRPRALYGPGDTAIMPRVLRALERRRLPVIGSGTNLTDLTFIDDAVQAMLCAAHAGERARGGTFNVTSGDSQPLWPLLFTVCDALGLPRPQRTVPRQVALAAAALLEGAAHLSGGAEPPLTRYAVSVLSSSVTLDISAARRDLGYQPRVRTADGLEQYLQAVRA